MFYFFIFYVDRLTRLYYVRVYNALLAIIILYLLCCGVARNIYITRYTSSLCTFTLYVSQCIDLFIFFL